MNFTFEWHYSRPGKQGIAGAVIAENQTRAIEIIKKYLFNHFHMAVTERPNKALYVWTSREEWDWVNADPNCHVIVY